MVQSPNPYEPSHHQSPRRSDVNTFTSSASVMWFVFPMFLITFFGTLFQPRADSRPLVLDIGTVTTVSLISAVVTILTLLIYGGINRILKRSCPPTRSSRAMAGIVFALITHTVFLFVIAVGFTGPPGIISLPLAALASTFVDRYLARIAHNVTEPSDERETSAPSGLNATSTPRSPLS